VVHIITTVTTEYETVEHGVVESGVRLAGNDEVLDALTEEVWCGRRRKQ